jgi:hypothetical protein
VFRGGDVRGLGLCLRTFVEGRSENHGLRLSATQTGENISAEVVAPYLIECLKDMTDATLGRPTPPWVSVNA